MEATKRRHGLANATEEDCISPEEGPALPAGARGFDRRLKEHQDVSPGQENGSGMASWNHASVCRARGCPSCLAGEGNADVALRVGLGGGWVWSLDGLLACGRSRSLSSKDWLDLGGAVSSQSARPQGQRVKNTGNKKI